MKFALLSFFLIIMIACQSGNDSSINNAWPWNALLSVDQIQIPIFENSQKKEVKYYILNDTIKEEYFLVQIIYKKGDLVKVKTASALQEDKISEGWTELKYLGIYTNPKNKEGSINLYTKPNEKSDSLKLITNSILYILDIKDEWYKVSLESGGVQKSGWIRKKDQCANPYSTCN